MARRAAPINPLVAPFRLASTRTKRALVIVVALAFPLVTAACDPDPAPQAAGALAPAAEQVRTLVNQARADNGTATLYTDNILQARAQAWAEHLAAIGGLEHTPDLGAGLSFHWRVLGENVGYGADVANVCDAFLNSPSHRANVLDPRFTLIGVGVAVDGQGRTFVVQQFAAL
jgi:uncharacterized protein YkwD